MINNPVLIEHRAQRRAVVSGPEHPIITDRRAAWRRRLAGHQVTGRRFPLRIWR